MRRSLRELRLPPPVEWGCYNWVCIAGSARCAPQFKSRARNSPTRIWCAQAGKRWSKASDDPDQHGKSQLPIGSVRMSAEKRQVQIDPSQGYPHFMVPQHDGTAVIMTHEVARALISCRGSCGRRSGSASAPVQARGDAPLQQRGVVGPRAYNFDKMVCT